MADTFLKTLVAVAVITIVTVRVSANLVFDPYGPPTTLASMQTADSGTLAVNFPDRALRKCIEDALEKQEGELITQQELAKLRVLYCDSRDVTQLSGIEYAEDLKLLSLHVNQISDLRHLANLAQLERMNLGSNRIVDLTPLERLTGLRDITLANNDITDLAPLTGMPMLEELHAAENQISDLAPLRGLAELTKLYLGDNWISDLTPLKGLTALETLALSGNQVSDLTALVSNVGLNEGDQLRLDRNPLSYVAITADVPKLRDRGVEVSFDPVEPISDDATIVKFSDQALEQAIRQILGKGNGWPVTASEMARFQGLALEGLGIEDLTA